MRGYNISDSNHFFLFSTVNESFTKLRLTCFHAVDFCLGVIISLVAIETGRIFQSKVSCFLLRFAVSFSQVSCLCFSSFLCHLVIICFVPWIFHSYASKTLCIFAHCPLLFCVVVLIFCFMPTLGVQESSVQLESIQSSCQCEQP